MNQGFGIGQTLLLVHAESEKKKQVRVNNENTTEIAAGQNEQPGGVCKSA